MLLLLLVTTVLTITALLQQVNGAVQYSGLNEAGLEFGTTINGPSPGTIPGQLGTHYFAPDPAALQHASQSIGANLFRLCIIWERLQPTPMGNLDTTYLNIVKQSVADIKATGAVAVVDLHNFARYNGQITTGSALADVWTRISQLFANDPLVWFGLMNEPEQIDSTQWFSIAQAAISAIRNTVKANNVITVPGNSYTGAHRWVKGGWDLGIPNAQAALAVNDPMNNMVFEMHQYLDFDFSGAHAECTQDGSQVLVDATNWLRANGKKGYIGEVGVGNNANCINELDKILTYLDANSDVWVGYTYWAGGSHWGPYILGVESTSAAMDAQYGQVPILAKHKGMGKQAATTPPATTTTKTTTTTTTTQTPTQTPTTATTTTQVKPPPPPALSSPATTSTPSLVTVTVTVTSTIFTTVTATTTAAGGPAPPTPTNNNLNLPTVTHTIAAGLQPDKGWCTNNLFSTQLSNTVTAVQPSIPNTLCTQNQPMDECGLVTITGSVTTTTGMPVSIVSFNGAGSTVNGNTFTFTETNDMPYNGGTLTLMLPCDYAGTTTNPAMVGQTIQVTFSAAAQNPTTMLTMANGNQVAANIVVVSA